MKNNKRTPLPSEQMAPASLPGGTLRLEWRSPEELAENPRNWRTHPAVQVAALTDVLAEVGWAGALLFNEGTGRLIDGHARRKVALEQGAAKVPVLVGCWNEEEEKKILATLDPLAAMAEADTPRLDALLREVQTGSEEVASMLSNLAQENGILNGVNGEAEPEDVGPQMDRAAELQEKWQTTRGQLWEIPSKSVLGKSHRLLCGDSTKAEDVGLVMNGEKAGLMNTDPPYGVDVSNVYRKYNRNHGDGGHANIVNDDCEDAAVLLLDVAMAIAKPVLKDNSAWFIWHTHSLSPVLFSLFVKHLGKPPRACIVWVKSHFVIGRNHYHQQHELTFYGWLGTNQPPFLGERNQSTVWQVEGGGGHKHENHPTEKPVELFVRPIKNHLNPGEIAYEPFSGSGSQFVAAEQLGRLCYGIEIESKYVAVALERLSSLGLEPRLANLVLSES